MVKICPCMADTFPLAKKKLTSATSSGSIQRLIGVSLATQSAKPPGSKSSSSHASLDSTWSDPKDLSQILHNQGQLLGKALLEHAWRKYKRDRLHQLE